MCRSRLVAAGMVAAAAMVLMQQPAAAAPVSGNKFAAAVNSKYATVISPDATVRVILHASSQRPVRSGEKFTLAHTVNPDGSSLSYATALGIPTETRCTAEGECWVRSGDAESWIKSPTGSVELSDLVNLPYRVSARSGATYDITGNTFTVKEKATTTVITFNRDTVNIVATSKRPTGTTTVSMLVSETDPVEVTTPQ